MDRSVEGPVNGRTPNEWKWRINGVVFDLPRCYTPIRAIGTGAYGCVVSARNDATGQYVAIKKITNAFANLEDTKRILREIKLLRALRHDHVISIVDMFPPPSKEEFNDIYIVNELMETDIAKVLRTSVSLSEDHIQYFVYQVLVGLKYIHSAGVLHRDLKPSNLLTNADCLLSIADFGLARTEGMFGHMTEYVATRWYRAPEIILSWRHYSQAIDIWSVGCIFGEMLLRRPLFPGTDFIDEIVCITNILGKPTAEEIAKVVEPQARHFLEQMPYKPRIPWAQIFKGANPLGLDLIGRMLCFDPDKRWSAEQLLAHPYFESLHDRTYEPVAEHRFNFDFEQWQPSREVYKELILQDIRDFHPEAFQQHPQSFQPMAQHEMVLPEQQQRQLQLEQERLEQEFWQQHQAAFCSALQDYAPEFGQQGQMQQQQRHAGQRMDEEASQHPSSQTHTMELPMGSWTDGSTEQGNFMVLSESSGSVRNSDDMCVQTPLAGEEHGSFFQI